MLLRLLVGSLGLLGLAVHAESLKLEPVFTVSEGLANPESALWDAACGCFYISNVNGGAMDADGNGYLSKLAPDGTLSTPQWVTGLNAPKGMAVHAGKLYVSDINELVVIDTATGQVSARHAAPDSKFLNDVAVGPDGAVYVSDMLVNTVYRLQGAEFSAWAKGAALDFPNGLHAEPERLLLASWGAIDGEGFATSVPGRLKSIDYATAEVTDLSAKPVGNLDGIEPDGHGGYLVTDWFAGKLFRMAPGHGHELLLTLKQGSADLGIKVDDGLVVIPMMLDNSLQAYRLTP